MVMTVSGDKMKRFKFFRQTRCKKEIHIRFVCVVSTPSISQDRIDLPFDLR